MKKRIRQWVALYAAVGIIGSAVMGRDSSTSRLGAGGGQISRETADGTGTGSGGGAHIGVIFVEAGLRGNSFNDLALGGVKKAATDYGITCDEVEPKSVPDEETTQDETAASRDYDLIICVGIEQVGVLTNVTFTHPKQRLVLLDVTSNLPNIASYFCKGQGGALLAGALAALAKQEKTDDELGGGKAIGFIGGMSDPPTNRFAAGYKVGVEYIEPEVKVFVDYTGGFSDPATAKTIANTFMEKGVDVTLHATGASRTGMFQTTEEKGFAAIGMNLNQNGIALGCIMASTLEKLGSCAYHAIASIVEDAYTGENQMLGLSDRGAGVMVEGSSIKISDDVLARLDKLKQKIISGEIQVFFEFN